MGYSMRLRDSEFHISKDNLEGLYQRLVSADMSKYFSDTTVANLRKAKERNEPLTDIIDTAFYEFHYWHIMTDDDGNITDITFDGDRLRTEPDFFHDIAEFVEDGSYIEAEGEDYYLWRWVFKDGICNEVEPTITWG